MSSLSCPYCWSSISEDWSNCSSFAGHIDNYNISEVDYTGTCDNCHCVFNVSGTIWESDDGYTDENLNISLIATPDER